MSLLIEIEIDVEQGRVNKDTIARAMNEIAKVIYATEALGRPTVATVVSTSLGPADLSLRFLVAQQRAQEPESFEDS